MTTFSLLEIGATVDEFIFLAELRSKEDINQMSTKVVQNSLLLFLVEAGKMLPLLAIAACLTVSIDRFYVLNQVKSI